MEIFLSSAKRGYGLKQLLSSSHSEYWHSDDSLPHSITISFFKKTYVFSVNILLSYFLDESYTPENICVYYKSQSKDNKNLFADFKEAKYAFKEPEGEMVLKIEDFVFEIYLVILNNHTDGKDSHIRNLRVMKSPQESYSYDMNKYF